MDAMEIIKLFGAVALKMLVIWGTGLLIAIPLMKVIIDVVYEYVRKR